MKLTLAITVLLFAPLRAQTVTFSPQGAAALRALTGKRISGFQIVSVMACADAMSAGFSGGEIYQKASQQGYQWIDPMATTAILERTVQFNAANLIPVLLTSGTAGFSLLLSGGIIKATSSSWLTALIASHGVLDQASNQIRGYAPNPATVVDNLLRPTDSFSLASSQCIERYLGAVYNKQYRPSTVKLAAYSTDIQPTGYNFEVAQKIVRAHLAALEAETF